MAISPLFRAGGRPWLFVPATEAAQAAAVRELVRPDEVAHLTCGLDRADPAWSIGKWIRGLRALGALRYMDDPPGGDLWRAPACTISSGGGDCEDFAILAAAMLLAMAEADVDVIVGLFDGQPHAWIEGVDRAGYFLIETTRGDLYDGPNPHYAPRRRFPV